MSDYSPTLILSAPPALVKAAQASGLTVACMAYRLGTGLHLLRAQLDNSLRGGLMMLDDQGFDPSRPGYSNQFVQEVLRELSARGFTGVIANWEGEPSPPLRQVTLQLGAALAQRKLSFYVPERWGKAAPRARVLITSAISGGTLRGRITEAGNTFGMERVVLAIERSGEEFLLPAPQGRGTPLSEEELGRRLTGLHPRIYFSTELCAHYFTWMGRDGRARFVLFDNESSIRKKIHLAGTLKVPACLLAYPEVEEFLPKLLQ